MLNRLGAESRLCYITTTMGSLCSKPDVHSGGTQVLGRSSGAVPTSRPAPANGADARAARAEAAEQRLKAVST